MSTPAPHSGQRRSGTLLDRTLRNLRQGWRDIASSLGATGEVSPELQASDARQLRKQMRECLEAKGGEITARARAAALGRSYLDLNDVGRERFLRLLAVDFDTDHEAVDRAMETVAKARGRASRRRAETALTTVLQAPRVRLLTQFNALPEGVKFLVDMRADVMRLGKDDPALNAVEEDLRNLLVSWFDVGFLELRRITWDSPASLLERIVDYEAVHEISSWQDLKNRLDTDRRLFAFFHPRMPDEPLIFVEVALVNGMADSIQRLLDPQAPDTDPGTADTAIFYSISNAQRGLAGVSFGGFLIKRVVDVLQADLPHIKTFATLSPVPGFHHWLDEQLLRLEEGREKPGALFTAAEQKALAALPEPVEDEAGLSRLLSIPDWHRKRALAEALRTPLLRLCAQYLLQAKKPHGGARDPVAHFHLSNGARLERLNWLADTSAKGLRQSAGIMVNYLYRLDRIEARHEAYSASGEIAAASAVRNLARD